MLFRSAKDTKFEGGVFSTDIAGAYGIEELTSLVRTFNFTDDEMKMTDSIVYSGNGTIVERLATFIEPAIEEKGKIVLEDTVVTYDPDVCEVSVTPDKTTAGAKLFFIDFKLCDGAREFNIVVK